MRYRVLEYNRPRGCGVWTADGLDDIPPELFAEVQATVETVNRRLGWRRFQVVSVGGPYETCLTAD